MPVKTPQKHISLFLAGDALIARPLSDYTHPRFLKLVEQIREADVAIANLETLFHEYRGHAQADSGGTYVAAPPRVAFDLAWAGFEMVSHANNHSPGIVESSRTRNVFDASEGRLEA